jgi:non-specific serine/threonine protein kinase
MALMDLGNLAIERDDLEGARALYEAALKEFETVGDKTNIALMLANLANLARAQGDLDRAGSLALESLERQRETGNERCLAYARLYLGDICRDKGDLKDAWIHYRECLTMNAKIRHIAGVSECLEHMAWLAALDNQQQRAATLLGAAAGLRESTQMVLSPGDQMYHQRALDRAHRELDDAELNQAWDRGHAMDGEIAVASALVEA